MRNENLKNKFLSKRNFSYSDKLMYTSEGLFYTSKKLRRKMLYENIQVDLI